MDASIKDRYYWRNVAGISTVEFLWGLGLPVVVESTFLQLFVKSLGASSLVLGLVPFFFFVGTSVFALLSTYLTEGMAFKRGAVIWLHVVSGAALVAFGAVLHAVDRSSHLLVVFFTCYGVFSLCVGMTLPVWLNYLVKIFSERRSVAGLAYMMIAQNAAKLASSIAILKIVDRYAFSREAAAGVFLGVGGLFCVGALFFLLTWEPPEPDAPGGRARNGFAGFFTRSIRHMARNRNFLVFLAADLEFYIVVTIISFYAACATDHAGISPAAASGAFVGLIYAGAIAANIGLGTLGWLSLKQKTLFSKMAAMAAALAMAAWMTPPSFYAASLLLGVSRGTRMLVHPPAVKRLSGLEDATAYFAAAPILTLPVATGLPLLCGRFLDSYAGPGADAYRIVYSTAALLLAGTFACALKTDFSRRQVSKPPGV